MSKYGRDFIPGGQVEEVESSTPKGFNYWRPNWTLVDGKVVKETGPLKKEEKFVDVYECNECGFSSQSERGIKIHMAKHEKN